MQAGICCASANSCGRRGWDAKPFGHGWPRRRLGWAETASLASVPALLEGRIDETRRCPHCAVEGAAARCGVADTTSSRWRHRFLAAVEAGAIELEGFVEADETRVLASRNGARKLDRKARKRGGGAEQRGLSKEQAPIPVAR